MQYRCLLAVSLASLILPALTMAAEVDTGSVPATKSQMDVMKDVPESVTNRTPEARGMTTGDMAVSPVQGQVSRELEDRFGYLDIDKSGQISRSEGSSDPDLESQWKQLDTNRDGNLNRAEFSAFESTAQ